MVVDSSAQNALTASGGARIAAGGIGVVGGVKATGSPTLTPTPVTGIAYQPDFLAGLPEPGPGPVLGSVNLGGNSTLTINPGVYNRISVSASAHLILNPGIYVLAGGGLKVSGNGSVKVAGGGPFDPFTGDGVLIDNSGSNFPYPGGTFGPITITGSGSVQLIPPDTGFDLGIAILQPYGNTQPLAITGNAVLGLDGGALFAPSASLSVSGSAQLSQAALVIDELQLTGSASVTGLAPASGGAAIAQGQLGFAGGQAANPPASIGTTATSPGRSSSPSVLRSAASVVITTARSKVTVRLAAVGDAGNSSGNARTLVDSEAMSEVAAGLAAIGGSQIKTKARTS